MAWFKWSPRPFEKLPVSTASEIQTGIDCLRLSLAMTPGNAAVTSGAALLITLWLWPHADTDLLGVWLVAMLTVVLGRVGWFFAYRRDAQGAPDRVRSLRWDQAQALLTFFGGCLWGLLVWVPIDDPLQSRVLVLVCFLFCIMLVSTGTLVASRLSFFAFALPLFMVLLARLPTLGAGGVTWFIAGGLVLMAVLLASSYRNQHQTLIAALDSYHRSQALLKQQQVIFESAGEGIVLLLPSPVYVVECNGRFAEMFGYPREAMKGMEPWRWHPDREQWKRLVIDSGPVIAKGQPYEADMPLRRADGSCFWAEVTGMAVDPSDLRAGTVWVVSDLTRQRQVEEALRLSEQRFRALATLSSDLYWEQDADFCFVQFQGAEAILKKIGAEKLMGQCHWKNQQMVPEGDAAWREHQLQLARHQSFRDFFVQIDGADGVVRWYAISGNPRFDAAGTFCGYHGTASDVTSRIEEETRFRYQAFHDSLTRLPNRRLLDDRLRQAIRAAERHQHQVALLLIDLDGFKQINDLHGHATGDRVLEVVAERLRGVVRDMDTVARLGGDEFVILLPEAGSVDDALVVAEKVQQIVCAEIDLSTTPLYVGASIGVSLYPEHGTDTDALLQQADQAMYCSKRQGGGTTQVGVSSASSVVSSAGLPAG